MCYIFNLWDTQTLTKKTSRRKNVNFCAFPMFEKNIFFRISLPVFNAAFVRGVALFPLHCYSCISGRGWVQETAGMHSLSRHFGNCQECAANGGYEATTIFFPGTLEWIPQVNTWGTHLNKNCVSYLQKATCYALLNLMYREILVQVYFPSFPTPVVQFYLVSLNPFWIRVHNTSTT